MRLLLIEDSSRLRSLLAELVHERGWRIDCLGTASDAREAIANITYDLYVIDLGLPDGNGLDLVREIRAHRAASPILILSARAGIDDRVVGLDCGADDYLVKPLSSREFLARCRALLRRSPVSLMPVMMVGLIAFDTAQGLVTCAGKPLDLTTRERSVLECLMREEGRVVPKRRLEQKLSEFSAELSTNGVELAMSRLRRKLDGHDTGVVVETVRGIGYLLRDISA